MFITIDGPSGAGKSTQLFILSKHFDLAKPDFFKIRQSFISPELSMPHTSPTLHVIALSQLLAIHSMCLGPENNNVIVEHFWDYFHPYFKRNANSCSDIINFIRNTMESTNCRRPDLSIILDLPLSIADSRIATRDSKEYARQQDRYPEMPAFYRMLENQVPYCHIVDSAGSIDKVSQSILQLIEAKLHYEN